MQRDSATRKQKRSFGLIVGIGFAVIATWPVVFRGESPRAWALAVSFALVALALVAPGLLGPLRLAWMRVGEILGAVNSRIILTLVYYLFIVPIGSVRRLTGGDPMRRAFEPEATTYKIPRTERPASHMRRQY